MLFVEHIAVVHSDAIVAKLMKTKSRGVTVIGQGGTKLEFFEADRSSPAFLLRKIRHKGIEIHGLQ